MRPDLLANRSAICFLITAFRHVIQIRAIPWPRARETRRVPRRTLLQHGDKIGIFQRNDYFPAFVAPRSGINALGFFVEQELRLVFGEIFLEEAADLASASRSDAASSGRPATG